MSTTTKPRATKKFKALVAALGSEDAATVVWNQKFPDNPVGGKTETLPENVQKLVDAGFSVDEARELVGEAPAETAPLTSEEQAKVLYTKQGLIHVRGRVYSGTEIIEAQVRVLKTGKPEVVKTSGERHTKAVAIWRTEEGDSIAVQNLGEAN